MTHEEIRARLFQVSSGLNQGPSVAILNGNDPNFFPYQRQADRLLVAHLEITKQLREAADELAVALEFILPYAKTTCATTDQEKQNPFFSFYQRAINALARYRAVKGKG